MMVHLAPKAAYTSAGAIRRNVLYVGPHPDEIRQIFEPLAEVVAPAYAKDVHEALFFSRNYEFDHIVIDQRAPDLATRLILPLMACFDKPVNLVVISALQGADAYAKVPGAARIVPLPLTQARLMRAIGLAADGAPSSISGRNSTLKDGLSTAPLPEEPARPDVKAAYRQFPVLTAGRLALAACLAFLAAMLGGSIYYKSLPQVFENYSASDPIVEDPQNPALLAVADRIERARNEVHNAELSFSNAKSELTLLLDNVRNLQARAQIDFDNQNRLVGIVMREREMLTTQRSWSRSLAEIKKRNASGELSNASKQLSVLRILKTDERLAELAVELNVKEKAAQNAKHRLSVINALMSNLNGVAAPVPKQPPIELLPLVRRAALTVARLEELREKLEAARQTLQLFIDKKNQLAKGFA